VQSVVSASPRLKPSSFTTAASAAPGRLTVMPPTVLSYWSQTQAREHKSGQAINFRRAPVRPIRSSIRAGLSFSRFGGSIVGRCRAVPDRSAVPAGFRLQLAVVPDGQPSGVGQFANDGEVEVHFSKISRAISCRSGRSTISMRSWLSDSMNS